MHGDYTKWRGIGAMPRKPDWDGIRVYERGLPPNPTLREFAVARDTTPADVMIDLALDTNFEQLFIQPSLYPQDHDVLMKVLRHPRTVMTFSDSGAHMSQICDSSIHTHLLGYWVREQGEFTLEEGVRMITLAPALAWGFADRGLLREGMAADVNVFDPDVVAPSVPRIVHDLPSGGKRLEQRAVGFHATVVGGEVTIVDAEPTGALPGAVHPQPHRRPSRRRALTTHADSAEWVDHPALSLPQHHSLDCVAGHEERDAPSFLIRDGDHAVVALGGVRVGAEDFVTRTADVDAGDRADARCAHFDLHDRRARVSQHSDVSERETVPASGRTSKPHPVFSMTARAGALASSIVMPSLIGPSPA